MAVVSRIATVRISNSTGSRTWRATAAVQDSAAGASVVVTVEQFIGGTLAPAQSSVDPSFNMTFCDDAGNTILQVALDNSASKDYTFYFTDNGLVGGNPRCGTVEIKIRAFRTGVDGYDVETDGSPNTPGTGNSVTQLDRGYIRGTTTLVEAISNVSLGGAKSEPAEYDESLFVRLTCGHISYIARALSVAVASGGPSGNTNSTTAVQRDATFANSVDDRFPAALTANVGLTVTVPNATLTGLSDWTHTSTTDDDIDIDPRIDVQWHFQKDQATFDTSYHDASFNMLASEVGQAAARFKKRRTAGGINGLSVTLTADPVAPGSTSSANSTTSTLDSEVGWSGLVDVSPTGKPGGVWNLAADVTSPSDADLDTLLVGNTQVATVLAPNPAYAVLCGAGSGVDLRHFIQGDDFVVGGGLVNGVTGQILSPSGTPTVILARQTAAGKVEYLDAAYAWNEIVGAEQAYKHSLVSADNYILGADVRVYMLILVAALGITWGEKAISCLLEFEDTNGTPYIGQTTTFISGGENRHNGFKFDPIGLFK